MIIHYIKEVKHFFHYCLQVRCITPKKGKYVKLKKYDRKIKSTFMIYADFESILVPENDGK